MIRINKNSNIKLRRYTLYQHQLIFDDKNYDNKLPKITKKIKRSGLFHKKFPNFRNIFKEKKIQIKMKKKEFPFN